MITQKYKCTYCGATFEALQYSIHRDGFGIGPEVPLCSGCVENPLILMEDIWERIAYPEPLIDAIKEVQQCNNA